MAPGSESLVIVLPWFVAGQESIGVNQVAQSGRIIAIASSTVQGGHDSPPTVDNMGPSLLFWKENFGTTCSSCSLKDVAMTNHFNRVSANVCSHKTI